MPSLALRDLVLQSNLAAHGVAITVIRPFPDHEPITTTGIWLTPPSEEYPVGQSLTRREMRRVMAIGRADVPTIPLKTVVVAIERLGGDAIRWLVDGFELAEAEHQRVILVRETC